VTALSSPTSHGRRPQQQRQRSRPRSRSGRR
jgi:hypothetical protein